MMKHSQDVNTAVQLLRGGRLAEAAAAFRVILDRDPDQAEVLHHLALVTAQAKQVDQSIVMLKRVIALAPSDARARYHLGLMLANRQRLDDAVDQFRRAIRIEVELFEAYARLGRILDAQNRGEDAARATRGAVLSRPDRAESYFEDARLAGDLGCLERMVLGYQRGYVLSRSAAADALFH